MRPGPITGKPDTRLTAIAFAEDPQLGTIDTRGGVSAVRGDSARDEPFSPIRCPCHNERHNGLAGEGTAPVTSQTLVHPDLRRQWLPWRPRTRVVFFWNRGIAILGRVMSANQQWFDARARGPAAWVLIPLFFFVQFWISILGVAVAAEVTIFPFAVSLYAIFFEWLALVVLFPFVLLVRVISRKPWPTISRHRSKRIIWP